MKRDKHEMKAMRDTIVYIEYLIGIGVEYYQIWTSEKEKKSGAVDR